MKMETFGRARPSYRAAHWKRLFSLPHQCVEGSRTPIVALVCGWGGAIRYANVEPLRRLEVADVSWHYDDEPLFGGIGDPKLNVSLSLGSSVT